MKDIIDGGTFSPSERRSALLGFGLAGLLVLSALTMSMISTDVVAYDNEEPFFENAYFWQSGGGATTPTFAYSGNQLAVGPHAQAIPTAFELWGNTTTLDHEFLESLRNINLNFSQIVGSRVDIRLMSPSNTIEWQHVSTSSDLVDIDNTSGKTYINITLREVDAMHLASQYVAGSQLKIVIDQASSPTDFTKSTSVEFEVLVDNESELANFLIWAVMSFALYIPLMIYLDAFNNIRRFVDNPLGRRRRRMTKMSRR